MSPSAVAKVIGVAGASAGVLVAGTAAGVLAGRRRAARHRLLPDQSDVPLGSLRGERRTVLTAEGVPLHAEVDEPSDATAQNPPTIVFVHGFGLNLDGWHYQRLALRPRHRLVFFDQRSHGRSGPSAARDCTIDRLGEDLRKVVDELAPEGRVVLVGHSMGGMTVLAAAHRHPAWFRERVAGVTLVSTCADGVGDVTFGLPRGMAKLLNDASPSLLNALARAPKLVERGRRFGTTYRFAMTRRMGFGGPVSQELVDFADAMISKTPIDVLANFYPEFFRLDKGEVLIAGEWPPTTIICGSRDLLTPVALSRRMADALPDARLVEIPDAGHLLILEKPDLVSEEIAALAARVQVRAG